MLNDQLVITSKNSPTYKLMTLWMFSDGKSEFQWRSIKLPIKKSLANSEYINLWTVPRNWCDFAWQTHHHKKCALTSCTDKYCLWLTPSQGLFLSGVPISVQSPHLWQGLLVRTLTAHILCCELVHSSVHDGANVVQKEIINVAIGKTHLAFI